MSGFVRMATRNLWSTTSYLHPARALVCAVAAAAVLGLTTLVPRTALAEPTERVAYSQKQVYSAAVRYLRIDLRYEITERDPDAAYLLFEYQPLGQKGMRFGAVEIVKLQQGVRLAVRMPDQPSYQETMLRDGLVKKLHADYGEVAPAKHDKPGESPKPGDDEEDEDEKPKDKPAEDRPNARS